MKYSVRDATLPFKLTLMHNKWMFYIDTIIPLMQPSLLYSDHAFWINWKNNYQISSFYSEYTVFPNSTLCEIFYLYQNPMNNNMNFFSFPGIQKFPRNNYNKNLQENISHMLRNFVFDRNLSILGKECLSMGMIYTISTYRFHLRK